MDTDAVAARLAASRDELRAGMLAGRPGFEDAEVFPRSRTMRLLLDPHRRGMALAVAGAVVSFLFGRRRRSGQDLASLIMGLARRP
jgi:hypothetical protein